MHKLNLLNKHTGLGESSDLNIYIGRGSALGNPFSHLDSSYPDVTKVETREIAVAKYQEYLIQKLKEKNIPIINQIKKIIKCLEISNVNLICFCKPKLCHGTIIIAVIENIINKPNKQN